MNWVEREGRGGDNGGLCYGEHLQVLNNGFALSMDLIICLPARS